MPVSKFPNRYTSKILALATASVLAAACGENNSSVDAPVTPDGPNAVTSAAVVANYAANAYANYSEIVLKTQTLKRAVDDFVTTPSAATLTAARTAWLAAREPYGQSEIYRFSDGPIDNPTDGPEGRINAWPMDEAHVDYVTGNTTAGIINNAALFPTITKALIVEQNENGGETNISSGYHAIEFLLWGQDSNPAGPGNRPHTDYVVGAGGTAANQARRGQYLVLTAEILVEDLTLVRDAWAPNATNYRKSFVEGDVKVSLQKILQGLGSIAGSELSGERMQVAIDNRDQEDEHSCFSDNTHRDIINNGLGVQNIYLGRYGAADGAGLDDLIAAINPALNLKMKAELDATNTALSAIPAPFDQAIIDNAKRPSVVAGIKALQAEAVTLVEVATALGIAINME